MSQTPEFDQWLASVRSVGTQMANTLYNISHRGTVVISGDDAEAMIKMVLAWDSIPQSPPTTDHLVGGVTDNMRSEACRVLNDRGKGNAITIPDVYAMLAAALVAHENDDLPQTPWPASGWALERIKALEGALKPFADSVIPDDGTVSGWRFGLQPSADDKYRAYSVFHTESSALSAEVEG